MEAYKNVRQGNLVDIVFEKLKDDIVSGKLKQGERFPPQEVLARQFGVSRPVIREAQKKLASLGLLESRQGSGTFVCRPRADEVMGPLLSVVEMDAESTAELMETRFHLEKVVARLAAQRATPDQAAELDLLIAQMTAAAKQGDLARFNRADFSFHLTLARISGNRIMARIVETIRDMTYRFLRSFSQSEGAMERAIRYHRAIAKAVAENDPRAAENQMRLHLNDIIKNLDRHFELRLDLDEPGREGTEDK